MHVAAVAVWQSQYIATYGIMVLFLVTVRVFEGFVFARVAMAASRTLHNTTFARVIRGTMAYFDTTPLGRILNRFCGG